MGIRKCDMITIWYIWSNSNLDKGEFTTNTIEYSLSQGIRSLLLNNLVAKKFTSSQTTF